MSGYAAIAPHALEQIRAGTRAEAQAAGARLAGVWAFYRACLRVLPDAELAVVDTYAEISAEIGACVNRSWQYGQAQLGYAIAMHERLPKVGAALLAGDIDFLTFKTIVNRTDVITDPDLLAAADERIAVLAAAWTGTPSTLCTRVDGIVADVDPDAVREKADNGIEDVRVDVTAAGGGFAEIHAKVFASSGAALDARLSALAHTVCPADPRSMDRRRADGLDALLAGMDRLRCRCTRTDCPARKAGKKAGPTTVYIVTERAHPHPERPQPEPVDPEPDPKPGPGPQPEPEPKPVDPDPGDREPATPGERDNGSESGDPTPAQEPSPGVEDAQPIKAQPTESRWRPGYLMGSDELIPPPVMAEIMATARQVRVTHPGPHSPPEPGYHPSHRLCAYVKARDLTCRAPGCTRPATHCQVDHTIPHDQGGPTHPSNLKLLCEFHHLLKTFWGWRDEQLPDGTVIWRTPAGQTFTTYPGSKDLYPSLCEPTGALQPPAEKITNRLDPNHPKMPTRTTTRTHARAERINRERTNNRVRNAADPPPF